jgi:aarF domain-containing kinase
MLLLDNFVHSDLHPGNILIKFVKQPSTMDVLKNVWHAVLHKNSPQLEHPEHDVHGCDEIVYRLQKLRAYPSAWRKELVQLQSDGYMPEIVVIDAGLTTTLNSMNRTNFLDLFQAVAQFDGYRSGKLMVERCRSPNLAIDVETFALKMQHIVLNVKRKTFSLGKIKISNILTDVLKAVRQHHVKMEADFINTVISMLLLEGIGRQLDPELDLFKSALPILRQLGRQMTAQQSLDSVRRLPGSNFEAFMKVLVYFLSLCL